MDNLIFLYWIKLRIQKIETFNKEKLTNLIIEIFYNHKFVQFKNCAVEELND